MERMKRKNWTQEGLRLRLMLMRILIFLLLVEAAFAVTRPEIRIPKVETAPRIEEFLEMNTSRKDMLEVKGFLQRERNDGEPSSRLTKVFLGYDDSNFYAVFLCFEPQSEKIQARMLNRGNLVLYSDDIVTVQLDTFNDQRRAYQFGSNVLGVQSGCDLVREFRHLGLFL